MEFRRKAENATANGGGFVPALPGTPHDDVCEEVRTIEIGRPIREIVVEPLEEPVPTREPLPAHEPGEDRPAAPAREEPETVPERVPA